LMHLDGLGLGTGVSNQDATVTRNKAKEFLLRQISHQGARDVSGFQDELEGTIESIVSTNDCFGIKPFTIPIGNEAIPANLGFNLSAPTTGLNLRRVLRGMQILKPILLEGSPGVGKTRLVIIFYGKLPFDVIPLTSIRLAQFDFGFSKSIGSPSCAN